ncbi:tRNA m(1)G methyltransferase, putative [Plasmodium knowlesi strain H]|uniref:tRNA (guanine(9)-N(1))-methyltransferase n=3 Tax=Plasmodium knowlesi TaxID=5850 RepID=A0A5K1UZK1_PLAKH|nr:tRNA m(1)G methyltransferase, putative [Plasmodium knowlesi strain H]OTN65248.1 putative tRNA m(1)G methyltransferase [Plasmodium knowlesi]CAA9988215.1 tRNA m(1)G methyltransferase, putative [Plasmodium knowlesi strain H]SBO20140.1 tRNA m(1)G methyltransferase, putative [Plasmodium knowlesi strain H]SBO20581.1 tRNA m(1)G methyltransferase, putative [Plasmodium knowlesi strain H]VVS77689.1 tRNA m(1)G methyltransferase, putative [Plasmodium knowlesi strain H]|eukprot:XP_002259192.1 tRNA m(1)G methyltransferase, putative [Plasmodium knowlesi strain H]
MGNTEGVDKAEGEVTEISAKGKEEGHVENSNDDLDEGSRLLASLANVVDQKDVDKVNKRGKKKTKKEKKKEKREYLKEKRKKNRPEEKKKRKEKKKNELLKILNGLNSSERIQFLNERRVIREEKKKKRQEFLMKAYNEGYKICYNCSFLSQMGEKEVSSLAKQVFLGYHYMIKEQLPVQFHFTSLINSDEFYTQLSEKYALEKWRVHIHQEDYWNLFPREKIVVLSPDAEEELTEVRDDEVYVISALVDRSVSKNLSFSQASLHNLVTKKLPIEKYFKKKKSNVLNVNTVVEILISFLKNKNWMKVFKECVPQKKVLCFCNGASTEGHRDEEADGDDEKKTDERYLEDNEKKYVNPDPL